MGSARRETLPIDDIDDADDIDDPRTEGQRRRVHTLSRTPEGAWKAEGRACALRRRVVDVVDVVGSSKGDAEVRPSPPRASLPPVTTRPEAASPIPPPPAMTLPDKGTPPAILIDEYDDPVAKALKNPDVAEHVRDALAPI